MVIISERANRLKASSSLLGKRMANSYLAVAPTERTEVTLKKRAKIPNSAGEYNLVNMGLNTRGRTWAIVVPVSRVIALFLRSDLDKSF